MRDRADDPAGRAHGPGGQCARGRRLRARDRACPRARPGGGGAQRHLRARRRAGLPLSARALRPGDQQVRHDVLRRPRHGVRQHPAGAAAGRVVMMVWQAHERNEWDVVIHRSLAAAGGPMALPSGGPDPFSLADPLAVTEILETARFADVAFTDVREPVYYGPDVAAAFDWVSGFMSTSEVLKRLDPAAAARAAGRLR